MCSIIRAFIIRYAWIMYSISFLIRTPTFEWCVVRCGSRTCIRNSHVQKRFVYELLRTQKSTKMIGSYAFMLLRKPTPSQRSPLNFQSNFCGRFFEVSIEQHKSKTESSSVEDGQHEKLAEQFRNLRADSSVHKETSLEQLLFSATFRKLGKQDSKLSPVSFVSP
jgi:hypothetical protein